MRDAHELRFAAPRPNSGFSPLELAGGGGGGDFSTSLPVINARPVSAELRAALDAWNQGSGLIDPTRTGTDPGIVDQIRDEYAPGGPWRGQFDLGAYLRGQGAFHERTPPTNAVVDGQILGPRGGPPITGPPSESLMDFIKSFDPRTGSGLVNLAGIIGGPRQANPRGAAEAGWTDMGFGHAEKEFPSSVAGWTVRRVPRKWMGEDRPDWVMSDPTPRITDDTGHLFQNADRSRWEIPGLMGRWTRVQRERARRGEDLAFPHDHTDRPGVPLAYNWVNDTTGEIGSSLDMTVRPGQTYVNWQGTKEQYQHGPEGGFFMADVDRIHRGLGNPVKATVINDDMQRALAKIGRVNPMFRYFTDVYGYKGEPRTRAQRERRNRGEPEDLGSFTSSVSPTQAPFIPQAGVGDVHRETLLNRLGQRLEARLDRDGHSAEVDRMHDENIDSTPDRLMAYMNFMRDEGYAASTLQWYGSRVRNLHQPLNREPPPPSTASSRSQLYEQQDVAMELAGLLGRQYHTQVHDIQQQHAGNLEDRIRAYIDLMRGPGGYGEAAIRSYEERLPDMFPRPPSPFDAAPDAGLMGPRFDEIMRLPPQDRIEALTGERNRVLDLPYDPHLEDDRWAYIHRIDNAWNDAVFRPSDPLPEGTLQRLDREPQLGDNLNEEPF